MAGIRHHIRGGTRGGQAEFSWTDVKANKYRENYLGHSLMAPVGRWQKGKDLTWYAKKSKKGQSAEEIQRQSKLDQERDRLKQEEEELMCQALGLAPPQRKPVTGRLSQEDVMKVIGKGATHDGQAEPSLGEQADRIQGLGFKGGSMSRQDKKLLDKGIKLFEGPGADETPQSALEKPQAEATGEEEGRGTREHGSEPATEREDRRTLSPSASSSHKKKHKKEKKHKKHKKHKKKHTEEKRRHTHQRDSASPPPHEQRRRRHDSDDEGDSYDDRHQRDHRGHEQRPARQQRRHNSSSADEERGRGTRHGARGERGRRSRGERDDRRRSSRGDRRKDGRTRSRSRSRSPVRR